MDAFLIISFSLVLPTHLCIRRFTSSMVLNFSIDNIVQNINFDSLPFKLIHDDHGCFIASSCIFVFFINYIKGKVWQLSGAGEPSWTVTSKQYEKNRKILKFWGIKYDQTFDVLANFQPEITLEEPSQKNLLLKSTKEFEHWFCFFARAPRMFFDAKTLHERWMFDHIWFPKVSVFFDLFFILFCIYCSWGCPCTRELKVQSLCHIT